MSNEYDLVEFNKVSADIAEIKSAGDFLPNCSTKEGYEASKRFCLDYTVKARGKLTDAHKSTKAPFLKTCRFLDEKKAELMEALRSIEMPHMLAYKGHDEKEAKDRADFRRSIMDKIVRISYYKTEAIGKTPEEIKVLIGKCGEIDTNDGFHHLKDDAVLKKEETLNYLNMKLVDTAMAELAEKELKKANEKQLMNDYDVALLLNEKFDRDAVDSLAREKEEFERQRIAAEAQAKKTEEDMLARASKQVEEMKREEREHIEHSRKAREQDERHVMEIGKTAVAAVVRRCKVTEEQAEMLIKAIALNLIPHVTIKY